DLNFRVFESMMCGPLLITPHLPQSGMEMLFREGEHYVSYLQGDAENAAAKARYYLEHRDECRRIAKAGREEILRRHTSKARAAQLQELLLGLSVTERANSIQGSAIAHFMTVIYCLKADPPMRLHAMRLALRKFEALAAERITFDDQTVASLIMFKYFLEKYGLLRESAHLLGLYEDQSAASSPLAIAIVDALNKVGERKRALAVAAITFSLPEAIIEAADMLMKTTCRQLFSSFGVETED
ncbi:MAG: glycosyltransferase, partial [bacterium]|nr:glycosyltransferase [bacterium]